MTLPPLPPPPPEHPYDGGIDRSPLLSVRATALRVIARVDLSLRRLAGQGLLIFVLGLSWLFLVGAWSEFRSGYGDRGYGAGLLAIGLPAFALSLTLLLLAAARERKINTLRRAWRATANPGMPSRTGHHTSWPATVEIVLGQSQDFSIPAGALAVRRVIWASLSAAVVLFGAVALYAGATGEYTGNMGGGYDPLAGSWMMGGWGVLVTTAGSRGFWKAVRPMSDTRDTGGSHSPGPEGSPPWEPWPYEEKDTRRDKKLLPDLLRSVRPGSAFDRRHRAMSTWTLVAAVGLIASGTALLGSGLLGPWPILPAALLALVLIVAVGGYDRRPLLPVLAVVAATFCFFVGHLVQQQRVLEERGEWLDAVVVHKHEGGGRGNQPKCDVEFLDGSAPDRVVCHGNSAVGDQLRVLVDPERAVAPSLSTPSVTGYTVTAGALGLVFAATVTVGSFTGHRRRLAVGPPSTA